MSIYLHACARIKPTTCPTAVLLVILALVTGHGHAVKLIANDGGEIVVDGRIAAIHCRALWGTNAIDERRVVVRRYPAERHVDLAYDELVLLVDFMTNYVQYVNDACRWAERQLRPRSNESVLIYRLLSAAWHLQMYTLIVGIGISVPLPRTGPPPRTGQPVLPQLDVFVALRADPTLERVTQAFTVHDDNLQQSTEPFLCHVCRQTYDRNGELHFRRMKACRHIFHRQTCVPDAKLTDSNKCPVECCYQVVRIPPADVLDLPTLGYGILFILPSVDIVDVVRSWQEVADWSQTRSRRRPLRSR
ncbi:RING-type domain-containing protein [Plasmodiophora brassicae]